MTHTRNDDGTVDLERRIADLARSARAAAAATAQLTRACKDAWIARAAERLEAARERILAANRDDVAEARRAGLEAPLLQRLALGDDKWRSMLAGLREVAALPDPVGEISTLSVRPNGLRVGRMRIPLGVIAIIYESRPSVTVDAAALCVKAGNAVILRGGSEAIRSNLALAEELRAAAGESGIPADAVTFVPTPDRAAVDFLLRHDREIDLVIPRGGPGLIRKVVETSTIPVIKHDAGVCHVFLDASADPDMAVAIVRDSKIRQMAVCNGLETLLVHRACARTLLSRVLEALTAEGVEIRGCPETQAIFPQAKPATEEDWRTEYLAPILAVRVVDGLDAAIEHVRTYGSSHTDVIVTGDYASSQAFVRRVDSSTVGVNCSTAYADGHRLGLGAEIGISTSKLHAYGPMGLEGLTTRKFVLFGDGQLRPD
jgi:glutamate-5-semialdehyde dehydrogenase